MVFKQVGSDTDSLINKFGLLNKSFANIRKDFTNGQGWRSFGNIVSSEDIANFEKFQKELQKGTSYHKAFNNNLVTSHTYIQQQASELRRLTTEQKLLTRQYNQGKISQNQYNTALLANKAQISSLTTKTQSLTLAQKASTIASKAMGVALNMALNIGIGLIINAIISGITKLVNSQKELAEQIQQNTDKANEYSKTIEDLIKRYSEFADKTSYTADEKETLLEIQEQLISTFGVEADTIDLVNGKYSEQLKIIQEINKEKLEQNQSTYIANRNNASNKTNYNNLGEKSFNFNSDIFGDNYDEIINKIENDLKSAGIFGGVKENSSLFLGQLLGYDSDIVFGSGDADYRLKQIRIYISAMEQYQQTNNQLYKDLVAYESELQNISDDYSEATLNLANNIFKIYTIDNDISKVGKDTFIEWKNGLLEQAKDDTDLQNALSGLLNNTFPDYVKYFNNLDLVKSKFGISDTINSASEGLKLAFINSLDDTDLDILVNKIEDPFKEGIEGAKQAIADFKADPNNAITPTFNYSEYSEQVDEVIKNVDKVQSALDKLNSGETFDSSNITDLANAFPDYSTKILSAANDTEKLKSVLTEIRTNTPRSLIDTLTNLKGLSKDDKEAVNGLITVLSNLSSVSSMYSDMLSDLETKENLLSTAYKEMHDDGQVSIGTYQKLIDSGLDYSEAIEIANGQITVNVEKLKELTEEKSKAEIETLKLARAELIYNSALAVAGGINVSEEIANIDREIEAKQKALEFLEGFDYTTTAKTTTSKENKPQSVLDFETEYARRQHEINMGRMKEDEDYYSWLENAAHTAYDGLKDYESDLWKYEEEVYKWRTDNEQKLFDQKINNLETLADKALDDLVNADGNKLELFVSFDYTREQLNAAISAIQKRIDDIRAGIISGTDDDIAKLEEKINTFTDKLKDIDEKEITSERDFLKNKKDEYSNYYDKQIDKLKEQQKEAEELAKKEKSAIQEKIDLLEEANSKKEEEIDLEKKKQAIENAKSQRTIARINADGTTSYVADTEKIKSAQEEYDKAQYEHQKSLFEAQIKAIETASDTTSEKYDEQINVLENQKKSIENKFDILINQLEDYFNSDTQTQSNSAVWDLIAKTTGSIYENGVWSDKDGNIIDINSLINSINDLAELEKNNVDTSQKNTVDNNKTETENKSQFDTIIKYFQSIGMKDVTAEKLEKYSTGLINNGLTFKNSVPVNSDSSTAKTIAYNNSNHTENISYSFTGDIVINNPVGNVDDLANEIIKSGATVFNQQIHTNRK